ncbi:MAG: transposase [Betaproteobacteria bacterium]|nr:transposase [Betaproteobacteria bacterium]
MPRRARLSLPGIPWHIIQRGNNRTVCFYAEEDYRRYLDELALLSRRFHCAIHAYVLMTNHVHLLLTPKEAEGPALMMKHLGQRYVQYINRTYRRSGALWEGRFRSCLTQSEDYVLSCYRYIELNPVRAGMVRHPHDYRWSSYHANGDGRADALIAPHAEYLALAREEGVRRAAYRELFKARMDPEKLDQIRQATNGNFALGDERLKKQIEVALGRRAERLEPGRKAARKPPPGQERLF